MPYCPKCDMEFIDGMTICSDCKGILAASREAAELMEPESAGSSDNKLPDDPEQPVLNAASGKVYIKKAEQYEDLRSSSSAFLLVGGFLLAAALLSFFKIINLPFAASSRIIYEILLLAMGLGSLAIAFQSLQSARRVGSQVAEEELATTRLIEWFLNHHDAETIDYQLEQEGGFEDLSPEEQSLKRFELIQDIFLITHDISDQSYVDLLAEEIYGRLYE